MPATCLVLAALLTPACASAAGPQAARPGEPDRRQEAAATRPSSPGGPVTHLGRTVLARTDVIVRARLSQKSSASNGAEIGRLVPDQWLRGVPPWDDEPLVVLSAAAGALPPVGHESLFLLANRQPSSNLEFIEAVRLDDADGAPRLAALREYLRIESLPTPEARVAALRAYLAPAILDGNRWTRANAAREYAALAAEVPGALTAADRAPLERAFAATGDRDVRGLLKSAIDACPVTPTRPVLPPAAAGRDAGARALDDATQRFEAAGALPAVRRQAIVDAAVAAGAGAVPLLARGLTDADPRVREAAVAAAGQLRIASLEPTIASMLAVDSSPAVRRTLVVAAGHLRSVSSVATLVVLAREDGPFSTDAVFALARIRSLEALAELRRLRAATTDVERGDLLDFLISDRFEAQERALEARPR